MFKPRYVDHQLRPPPGSLISHKASLA